MSITFIEGFKLIRDEESDTNTSEQSMETIGNLSDIASTCANVTAALVSGSTPNEKMISGLADATAVLSSLVSNVSNAVESGASKKVVQS